MPFTRHSKTGFFIVCYATVAFLIEVQANADTWRNLPLIQDGKVHPDWVQIGWGGFEVTNDSLQTVCVEQGMGLLVYKVEQFGNCQIRVVYRPKEAKSNAGIFVRVDSGILAKEHEKPTPIRRQPDGGLTDDSLQALQTASDKDQGPWYAVHHGYEVQICDGADANHRTGAIYSLSKAEPLPSAPASGWRTMIITLRGNVVSVEVDGKPVTTFDPDRAEATSNRNWYEPKREFKRPTTGYIGLQNHDPGDVVYFKEVSVRPLGSDK